MKVEATENAKEQDLSRKKLFKNLRNIYLTYGDPRDFDGNMSNVHNDEATVGQSNIILTRSLTKIKRISLNEVSTDIQAQSLIYRMKSILQTPGYIKLFKKMTHELRSDMDQIIIKMINNEITEQEDELTKHETHLILQENVNKEMKRLKKYCGSIVVDEYYNYLAMQYYLEIKMGIDNYLMNIFIIAKPDGKNGH